jgi:hypothetical protein
LLDIICVAEKFYSLLITTLCLFAELARGPRRRRGPCHGARRHPDRIQVHIAGALGLNKQPKLISWWPVDLHVPALSPVNLSGRLPQKVSRLRDPRVALLPREAGSGQRAKQADRGVQLLPEVHHDLDFSRRQRPLFQQLLGRKCQKSGVATFYPG